MPGGQAAEGDMTILSRLSVMCYAVAAAPFLFSVLTGSAAAAFLFLLFCGYSKKNCEKFNFFEIPELYYNYMVNEFALKADNFFFWKKNFDGEGYIYFMKKAKAFFCLGILFSSFLTVSAQEKTAASVFSLKDYEKMILSDKPKERLDAVYGLFNSTQSAAEQILIEAYAKEKDAYIKTQILEVLSYKKSTQAVAEIFSAFQDQNPEIRKSAWNSLNEEILSKKENMDKAKEIFKKEINPRVKIFGMKVFAIDKSSSSVKELSDMAKDGKENAEIRKMALNKLAEKKNKASEKELSDISKIKDKEISAEAKRLLNKK